jgi:hypothetical protein
MSRNNFNSGTVPYITRLPSTPGERTVDQDTRRSPRDLGQGSHVQRSDSFGFDGHADASYQGYGAYATLDGSRVDDSEFADPDWAGAKLEPERPATPTGPRDFTGRGPRSYRRSDARLHEEICELLTADTHIDASEIEVSVENGEVMLSGLVESRRLKHLAEDIAYRVSGVLDVTNRLKVGRLTGASHRTAENTADEPEDERPALLNSSLRAQRENAELRQQGDAEAQAERARDRRNLRDHAYQGPRDTSHSERLGKF